MRVKAMRKRPQLEGKLVKANLYLSDDAIKAIKAIKLIQNYRSYREVFDLLLTFAESEFKNKDEQPVDDKEPLDSDIPTTHLTRKSFAVNSHTLSELKIIAGSLNLKLDSMINNIANKIAELFIYVAKNPPFDDPIRALDEIDNVWGLMRDLRFRLEQTFPDLVDENYEINSINNYMADIENALNELYYLIESKLAN